MTRLKLYTAIYVVLFAFATVQLLVEQSGGLPYWTAFWVIIALSFVKAVMVAWYYQHLKWEPRSVSFTMFVGLLAALALTTAAAYSIL
ncbi:MULTISPECIES: cytochrome C oxidase subunit IV family protein [Halorussus]|uniref:cytochrome C oxidase subunit IV family protein n=1 Tax=Halorussus TaxID=1070314 RepID=UPI000E214938|nr:MULTISPECIES: cytochrome C oxidase subunit IV family protein [Halorussus]NHN61347.1 cytochrome C oxidase subunit IV family protein [Halorussus sp. JP-T4]